MSVAGMRSARLRVSRARQNSSFVVWFIGPKERVNSSDRGIRAHLFSNLAIICNRLHGLLTGSKPDPGFRERPSSTIAIPFQPSTGGGSYECRGTTCGGGGGERENHRGRRDAGSSGKHHGCQRSSQCHVSSYGHADG